MWLMSSSRLSCESLRLRPWLGFQLFRVPADHEGTGAIFNDYVFPIIAKYSQTYLATFMKCLNFSSYWCAMQLLVWHPWGKCCTQGLVFCHCFAIAKSSLSLYHKMHPCLEDMDPWGWTKSWNGFWFVDQEQATKLEADLENAKALQWRVRFIRSDCLWMLKVVDT